MPAALPGQQDGTPEPADRETASEASSPGSTASAITFTDREMAIINGQDPDRISESSEQQDQSQADAGTESPAAAELAASGGKEAASDLGAGGSGAGDPSNKPWYSDDHKAIGESFGWSEEDLKQFASEDDFHRTVRLLDKQLVAGVTAQLAQPATSQQPANGQPPQPAANGKPAEAKADPAATPGQVAARIASGEEFDLEKAMEGFDDGSKVILRHFYARQNKMQEELADTKKFVQEYREAAQREIEEQQRTYLVNSFHDIVDTMEESLFGRSLDKDGKPLILTKEQDAKRGALFENVKILTYGIQERARRLGQEPQYPPLKVLVQRAKQQVFADELARLEREQFQSRLSEQSKRRRPVAAHRPTATAKSEPHTSVDEATRLANLPQLNQMWEQMRESAGAV